MTKREQTKQWPKENRQNNDQKKTDKTMTKREQTKQWPKENRQNNDQKKTDKKTNNANIMFICDKHLTYYWQTLLHQVVSSTLHHTRESNW